MVTYRTGDQSKEDTLTAVRPSVDALAFTTKLVIADRNKSIDFVCIVSTLFEKVWCR
jgi:hypothetical protein